MCGHVCITSLAGVQPQGPAYPEIANQDQMPMPKNVNCFLSRVAEQEKVLRITAGFDVKPLCRDEQGERQRGRMKEKEGCVCFPMSACNCLGGLSLAC